MQAVPLMLGFTPLRSVVVLCLRGPRRRVALTVRGDLPPPGEDPAPLLELLAAAARRVRADAAVVVVYPPEPADVGELPAAELADAVARALRAEGMSLRDVICVAGGRWRSYRCSDPRCCPPAGSPLIGPDDPTTVYAATAAYRGQRALPSREALAETLRPVQFLERVGLEQALERAERQVVTELTDALGTASDPGGPLGPLRRRWAAEIRAVVERWAGTGPARLTDDEVARLHVLLGDVVVRDELVVDAGGERPDGRRAAAATELWTELVRRSVPPYDAPAATLLGHAAYLDGGGALARIALERALSSDPGYRLAALLLQLLDAGIPPAELRAGLGGAPPARRRPARARRRRP